MVVYKIKYLISHLNIQWGYRKWLAEQGLNPTDFLSALSDLLVTGYGTGHVTTGDAEAAIKINGNTINSTNITGNTATVNGQTVPLVSGTGGFTVATENGTLYAVDATGNATEVGKTGTVTSMATYVETANKWNNVSSDAQITFSNSDNLWAFDAYNDAYKSSEDFTSKYENLNGYLVPWKLIPAGKFGKVTATLQGDLENPDKVVFRTPKGTEFKSKNSGNTYEITIISGRENDAQEVYALYPENDTTMINLGKLNVATYTMQKHNLNLVPTAANTNLDAAALSAQINSIYRTIGIEWTVTIEEPFTTFDFQDGKLDADGSGFFSVYTDEMDALNEAFKTSGRTIVNENSYIFVVPAFNNAEGNISGDMPLGYQIGYITHNSDNSKLAHTISHELGHGMYQLYHTFSDKYNIAQGTTNNLMDYTETGKDLVKLQWDAVFDPGWKLPWLQGEDEGMEKIDNPTLFSISYDGNQIEHISDDISGKQFNTAQWSKDYSAPIAVALNSEFYCNLKINGAQTKQTVKIDLKTESPNETLSQTGNIKLKKYKHFNLVDSKIGDKLKLLDDIKVNEKSFAWNLQIGMDDNALHFNLGTTKNRIYSTFKKPSCDTLFETLLHIGCNAAQGANSEEEVVMNIFNDFADLHVEDKNGNQLGYYCNKCASAIDKYGELTMDLRCYTTHGLLQLKDGRCSAWQRFFIDICKAQGIKNIQEIVISSKSISELDKSVKDELMNNFFVADDGIDIAQLKLSDLNAPELVVKDEIPAQNNILPPNTFTNHAICLYNTIILDPSYGTTASSIEKYLKETIGHIRFQYKDVNKFVYFTYFNINQLKY